MITELPIFGICGGHESGKTTLIEALVPELRAAGLSIAVAKIHTSVVDVDREGKDSDRLFRAGADVFLEGAAEGFARTRPAPERPVSLALFDLARRYDLVLVEGRKRFEGARVWLLGEGETAAPEEANGALAVLPRDADRLEAVRRLLADWLPKQWLRTPVWACVLIGGQSRRMGTPKHLLRRGGRTWLEHTRDVLTRVCERVVIVGGGELPAGLKNATRLPDAPDVEGPMAGILAAMRWAPWASWIVSSCDLPNLSTEALKWLLSTRRSGVWATLPCLEGNQGVEPLLAYYDFRARALFETLAAERRFSPSQLAGLDKVISPAPPAAIVSAWDNVNTPEELGRSPST
jgi:molybdopterin-guanine dinucleotide biosynthesis protein MobB